jgi:hypothetical protein
VEKEILNFKRFLIEKKVYELDPEEETQVNTIIKRFLKFFPQSGSKKYEVIEKTPQVFYKDRLDHNGRFVLGDIDYTDLLTGEKRYVVVLVDFTRGHNRFANYDPYLDNIILYYYNTVVDESFLKDKIAHELYHAKQEQKKHGKDYAKSTTKRTTKKGTTTIRSKRGYYLDPREFPVYTTLIIKEIENVYNKASGSEKGEMLKFLNIFLKHGKPVLTELGVPSFLKDKEEFINTLYRNKDNPKYSSLYRKFSDKLYWIYSKLKEENKS